MAQANALIAAPHAAPAISITLSAHLAIPAISCSAPIAWPFHHVHLLTTSTLPTTFAWLATILALAASITLLIALLAAEDHCTAVLA